MAMEIFALSDRRLSSIAEWQRAIDAETFPFPARLTTDVPFGRLNGFLPAQYDGGLSSFECDHWAPRSIVDEYPDVDAGRDWKYALALRFGMRRGELECAWIAAAAYACDQRRGVRYGRGQAVPAGRSSAARSKDRG